MKPYFSEQGTISFKKLCKKNPQKQKTKQTTKMKKKSQPKLEIRTFFWEKNLLWKNDKNKAEGPGFLD